MTAFVLNHILGGGGFSSQLRRNLLALLEKYCPEIEVIAEAANAAEAKEKILSLGPNVLFLDINMPELKWFRFIGITQ